MRDDSQVRRWLTLQRGSRPLARQMQGVPPDTSVPVMSGRKGGPAPGERHLARTADLAPVGLGTPVLRAETVS